MVLHANGRTYRHSAGGDGRKGFSSGPSCGPVSCMHAMLVDIKYLGIYAGGASARLDWPI